MPSRREFVAGVVSVAGVAGGTALSSSTASASVPSAAASSDDGAAAGVDTVPAARTAAPTARTWSRTYSGAGEGRGLVRDIVGLPDGVALVGLVGESSRFRGWVARVDSGGRPHWHHRFGTPASAFLAGAATGADAESVIVAGVSNRGTEVSSPERTDPYLARVGPDGDAGWARTYQPAAPNGRSNALVAVDGEFVTAGSVTVDGAERPWTARIDEHGTRGWTWQGDRAGDVNAAVGLSESAVVGGSTWPPESDVPAPRGSQENAWAAKLTADGEVAWRWGSQREMGDRIEALAPGLDGGVVAVGRRDFATEDDGVGWLVALDAAGRKRWERTYPQDGWNWHHDVAAVGDEYVLVGTREDGTDADERGAWLLRVDAEGRDVWDHQADGGTRGFAVHPLADGGLLVGGERFVEEREQDQAWLAKLGGDPAPSSNGGLDLPSPPEWAGPLLAGGALGALGTAAATHVRRSRE